MFFFCYISWWNIRAWASWNFDLVQLFLISWSANCFARHAWFALSVLCHDRKFLLEAVGILGLYIYSSWIGLHIVFLGTHCVLCLFLFCTCKKILRAVGILRLCNSTSSFGLHIVLLGTHAVVPLFCFVMVKSCFQEGVRILSLCNYSWSTGVQIVLLGTHGVLYLIYVMLENSCLS